MTGAAAPIRLGLIGTGLAVEHLHWPALRQLTDRFRVTAYADRSPGQARRFASYSGVGADAHVSDHQALLARDDVDAVLISVPIAQLYQVAKDSLTAGKHVLCEKPTGTNEEEARAFLALPEAHPEQTILVGENLFYRDDARLARSLLDDGAIGRSHLLTARVVGQSVPRSGSFTSTPWRQHPAYRGGAHLDAGIHDIATIRMLGGDVQRVHGDVQWANSTIDAPSDLVLNLRFDDGVIGNYTASYAEIPLPHETNDTRLYGTEGTLVLDRAAGARRLRLHRADGSTETHLFHDIDNGYYAEWVNFFDAVRYAEPVVGSVRQTFANMLVILRALDSADRGTALPVEPPLGASAGVALWRPRGDGDLFTGLPGTHTVG